MYNPQFTKVLLAFAMSVWSATSSAETYTNSSWPKDGPKIFMMADELKLIEKAVVAELDSTYSTTSLADREQSDIGIYALLDWASLGNIEGLQNYCGPKCTRVGAMSFNRIFRYSDDDFGRKDIFIDLSRFVGPHTESGGTKIADDRLKCLAKIIAREIRIKDTYELRLLDCHSELLKGGVSHVSKHLVNKKSLWYVVQRLFSYVAQRLFV